MIDASDTGVTRFEEYTYANWIDGNPVYTKKVSEYSDNGYTETTYKYNGDVVIWSYIYDSDGECVMQDTVYLPAVHDEEITASELS